MDERGEHEQQAKERGQAIARQHEGAGQERKAAEDRAIDPAVSL
jgi:hypothetical protein